VTGTALRRIAQSRITSGDRVASVWPLPSGWSPAACVHFARSVDFDSLLPWRSMNFRSSAVAPGGPSWRFVGMANLLVAERSPRSIRLRRVGAVTASARLAGLFRVRRPRAG
jgi:hypothetical protein